MGLDRSADYWEGGSISSWLQEVTVCAMMRDSRYEREETYMAVMMDQ